MWSRIRKALVSKPIKIVTMVAGASADVVEVAIFAGVAANKLLTQLFGVLGGFATGATITGTLSTLASPDKSRKDKAMSVLACGPTAGLFYAIFIAEAAAAPMIFACVIGSSWGVETLDMLLRIYNREEITPSARNAYLSGTTKKLLTIGVLVNPDFRENSAKI